MHKLVTVLCILVLAVVPLTVSAQTEVNGWTCPEGFAGQTLSVFNWSTYVAEDTVSNFEAACGVTVVYDVYESNEALLARLSNGNPGYDLAFPSERTTSDMIGRGLLTPLDHTLIPNIANVNPNFLDRAFDPGNAYTMPYLWGTVAIGYNITTVGEEITSWEQVWAYDGPVAWLEDLRVMMGIALTLLGYDPNTENPDEIAEARNYLVAKGSNVVSIAGDDGQAQLERGDVDITIEYSGDIFQVIDACECEDFVYAIPEEGSNVWLDSMTIPVDAPNVALAHAFIDYILSPQVGADLSNYTAYGSPNGAAVEQGLIDEALLSNPGIYPSAEVEAKLFFVAERPDVEQIYNDAWDEIKILLGR